MRLLLCFLAAILCANSSIAQVGVDWRVVMLCDTCKPAIAYSTSPGNLTIMAQPLDRFDGYMRHYDIRTYDGGDTWGMFRDSIPFGSSEGQNENYFFVNASSFLWKSGRYLSYTQDSGRTGSGFQTYPVPFRFYMNTLEQGIGLIRDTLNGENTLDLRGTIDSGRYWYENTGNVYSTSLRPIDAQFLSDSEVVVLLGPTSSDGPATVLMTPDKGKSWNEVRHFPAGDSTFFRDVTQARNSQVLLIEAYGDSALFVSFDRGHSWQAIENDLDLGSSRTRISAAPGQPLLLWSAKAADHWGPIENLLEPYSSPHVYPSKIMLSMDTGRTWIEQDFYPPGLDSVQIYDVIPDGNRVHVVSYLDSTTYVSTATIGNLRVNNIALRSALTVSLFPNPVAPGGAITIHENVVASRYVIVDALGRERELGNVIEGRLDQQSSLLTPGAYTVMLYDRSKQVGQGKLIVQ